ncbi:SixA phosphatase family protein [Gillisia limnaea]|uniref:Putative phosphohistidine phosphatase, SixA n=1 Tax=Gillisia limnaea (strain DSM 15749 / LMG 21470 / R-8282) TaxID=865937 RepID=H2BZS3_GILLR|nr:histidine phosphatase family protein [Gillisia limnaea]EHQ01265.1 putative phosphohistidine phosphatase, SixA [Gillisia limnaea DSM 15749]
MKRLILVRHGKSSWENNLEDEKRPLKKRGYRDGELISTTFEEFVEQPLVIWSSPAVRALETAKIFKEKLNLKDENFFIKPSLYTFSSRDLFSQIQRCDPEIDQLMVFGHNPAMTVLVNDLGDKNFPSIPTTGLTVIDFKTNSWKDLKDGKTILNLFPKNLR